MEIERDGVKGKVSLTQKAYLQKVLQKFDIGCETMSVSNSLPFISNFQLAVDEYVLRSICQCSE